jgi:carbon monoxide dehydrogenase subunit G
MDLVNVFEVAGDPASVWQACLDMPLVVQCLPGATLSRSIDAQHHQGSIGVRIGPMQMEFSGQLHIAQTDVVGREALIHSQWNETRKRGAATAVTRLSVRADPARPGAFSQVKVASSVQLSGQLAQYARGVGVIQLAASAITREFAANLQAELARLAQAPASSAFTSPAQAQPPVRNKPMSPLRLIWQMWRDWLGRRADRTQR